MANLNKVLLIGNLTRDPELRTTPKGKSVADIGLAVNRRVSDGGGGWKDETTFVDVTLWGTTADNAAKYLAKGRPVFIEGRLDLQSWEDKETGQKRTKLKVVAESVQFLPSGAGKEKSHAGTTSGNSQEHRPTDQSDIIGENEDEDIPF